MRLVFGAFITLAGGILLSPAIFAQGSLAPPAPPGPTMKTLDQIEARTPISAAPFTITVPGSYYLTANLSVSGGDAITINVGGVTLDLNGFTIPSTANPAAGMGVHLIRPNSDTTIVNGHIRGGVTYSNGAFSAGPGFQDGIGFTGGGPVNQLLNTRVSGVSVSGVSRYGIAQLGFGSVIDHCMVNSTGNTGLNADVVQDSTAYRCGGSTAIQGSSVFNSRAYGVNGANGISGGAASNCTAGSDTGTSLAVSQIHNCFADNAGTNSKTRLLFPFATNQAGFDTGISIANTAADSSGGFTNGRAGTATLYFFGVNAPPAPVVSPSIGVGATYSTSLSTSAPGFQGYVEVVCDFPYAHGYGILSDLGATKLAANIPALILPVPNNAFRPNGMPESLGQ